MKIKVNNKPLTKEKREKTKKKQKTKERFSSLDELMAYVMELEARVEALEKKGNNKK